VPYKCPEKKKAYHKEYGKRWYEKNKATVKDRTRKNNLTYKQMWTEFKASQSCSVCYHQHPAVIDFHHTDPHPDNIKINALVKARRYALAIKEAQEKCIPLCANCHRILHDNERKANDAAKHANKKKKL
jgi:hypothetical protein